ncbi:MAG TPA: LPS assembly protein LptD, partial [Burkholderiaceae bacterium]
MPPLHRCTTARQAFKRLLLAAATGLGSAAVSAQTPPDGAALPAAPASAASAAASAPLVLQPSAQLAPPPSSDAARNRSTVVRADRVRARPDLETVAEGNVEFRRAGTVIRADRITYDSAEDRARARGNVHISRDGNHYWGPELELQLQRFEGFFLAPEFKLGRTGAGGRAQRFDFLDPSRFVAVGATYTSCPRDGSGDPDWLLSSDRVRIDLEANEGVAEGAVLRFLGVPILAAPVLSFPLTDERKSGWLPLAVNLDSKSGLELAVPYYWNIAPNRDATITPSVLSRRGAALGLEFRYLEPSDVGRLEFNTLPNDRVAQRDRWLADVTHDGTWRHNIHYGASAIRVSDDDYWKDFSQQIRSFTPRLLPLNARVDQRFERSAFDATWFAGTQQWQVLRSNEPGS